MPTETRWVYALDRKDRRIVCQVRELDDGTMEVEEHARFEDEASAAAFIHAWNRSPERRASRQQRRSSLWSAAWHLPR